LYAQKNKYFSRLNPGTVLKKIYTLFLLLLCCLPFFFYALFNIQQIRIQHLMKERLENQSLRQLVIAEQDIQWVNEGREILVDGKMFDIKTFHLEKGVYHISGLYDEEETSLVKQLEKQQQSNTTSGNKILVQFIQLFQSNLSQDFNSGCLLPTLSNNHAAEKDWSLASGSVAVLTPPPQMACSI
jgi:hypothetical protein